MTDARSPWHHEPRVRLTDQKAAKLFLERGGCCGQCGRKLHAGCDWIVEHKLALELGGDNSWANLSITGVACCKASKDADDHGRAGKIRRAAAKHIISKSMRKRSGLSKRPGMKFDWRRGRYVKEETQNHD